jgi:acyl carrier protein
MPVFDRATAVRLILHRLSCLGKELGKPALMQADEQTRLFGESSHLDSIALVTLMADLEEDVSQACGVGITIADERAMSRLTSPFRRVGLLADHLVELVAAARK